MRDITLEELLEAGCHFGHQVTRQNPKAREFVFEARDGIHIIDLAKTKEGLDEALEFVKKMGQENGILVVVGTKRQAVPIVEEEAVRAKEAITKANKEGVAPDLFTVTKRWIGGTLTNTVAVQRNFQRLRDLEKLFKSEDEKSRYTKKELVLFERELQKLKAYYAGISDMKGLPTVMFVIDTHMEYLAVREGNRMRVPVVGIVDTNADPDNIDYVIPANDDAVGSLKLLTAAVMDAWIEGKLSVGKKEKEEKTEEPKEEKPAKEKKVEKAEKEAPKKAAKASKKAEK